MENQQRGMIELYSPGSESELLLLRSLLDDAGIRYFVRNDVFGSLYSGPHVESYNRKILCVARVEIEEASELLDDFLVRTGRGGGSVEPPPGVVDRLLQRFAAWLSPQPEEERPRFRLIRNPHPDRRPSRQRSRPPLRLVGRR